MIELSVKVLDRLIELLKIRDKRLQQRFEKIHKPAYENLQRVHTDYLQLFTGAVEALQDALVEKRTLRRIESAAALKGGRRLTERLTFD